MSAQQKLTLRPPCSECPFRKGALPGWLGDDTPEEIWAKAHGDGVFGYHCHMDVELVARDPRSKDGYWRKDPTSVEQCTGALLHASKTGKMYAEPWREAARKAMAALSMRIDLTGILGIDFMKHHQKPKGRTTTMKTIILLLAVLAAGCATTVRTYDRDGNIIGSCRISGSKRGGSCVGYANGPRDR